MTKRSSTGSTWASVTRSDRERIDFVSRLLLGLLALLVTTPWSAPPAGAAVQVHQTPAGFIAETFPSGLAERKALWIAGDLKQETSAIMGHSLGLLRVRYWVEGRRTAWILEEIGKVEPITVGIVVEEGRIEQLKILIYRESRGWEVRYPFFTNQFAGAGADERGKGLDRRVEGISGATLSVNAVTRLARLALALDREADHSETDRPGALRMDAEPRLDPAEPTGEPEAERKTESKSGQRTGHGDEHSARQGGTRPIDGASTHVARRQR